MSAAPPTVLVIAGLDPTGGAGLVADVEAIAANGGRSATLCTALTSQNTCQVQTIQAVDVELLEQQWHCLWDDLSISAIKIGMLGDPAIAHWLAERLANLPSNQPLPVVLDPILKAGSGAALGPRALSSAIRSLLPYTTVCTPNTPELQTLTQTKNTAEGAQQLLAAGCEQVLVTGGHETGHWLQNQLYGATTGQWRFARQTQTYHGSGCSLAAAIAARLALGHSVLQASEHAQQWLNSAIQQGYALGACQWQPHRSAHDQGTTQERRHKGH